MKTTKKFWILCDKCSAPALAEFDGVPLCENCMLEETDMTQKEEIEHRISPLSDLQPFCDRFPAFCQSVA